MKQFQKHAEGTEQIHSDYIICLLFISKFKKNKFEYFVYIQRPGNTRIWWSHITLITHGMIISHSRIYRYHFAWVNIAFMILWWFFSSSSESEKIFAYSSHYAKWIMYIDLTGVWPAVMACQVGKKNSILIYKGNISSESEFESILISRQ